MRKKGFGALEIVVGILMIVVLVAVLLPALARVRRASDRTSCAKNLKQWHQVLTAYASENPEGTYPTFMLEIEDGLRSVNAAVAPDIMSLWPEYLTDPSILVCPSDETNSIERYQDDEGNWALHEPKVRERAGDSYNYIGWALDKCDADDPAQGIAEIISLLSMAGAKIPPIDNEGLQAPSQAVQALMGVIRQGVMAERAGTPIAQAAEDIRKSDLQVGTTLDGRKLGTGNTTTVYRLRPDLSNYVSTVESPAAGDSIREEEIFVMFDELATKAEDFSHTPAGCNVLYLDGHVEFVRFPGKAPVSERITNLITVLSGK